MKTHLKIDSKKVNYPVTEYIKDIWAFLKGYRIRFSIFTIILIISNLMPFVTAYFLGQIVDFFISYQSGMPLTKFYWYVLFIGLAGASQVYLRFVGKWEIGNIGAQIRAKSRVLAMTKLMDLELKWHEKEETGSKIQKISSGGESIHRTFSQFNDTIVPILTGLIGAFTIFAFLRPKYLIFIISYMAIYLISEFFMNKRIAYYQDQMNKVSEKVSGKIHEGASNVLTVKAMGLKDIFKQSVQSYEEQYYEMWKKLRKANQDKFRFVKILASLAYASFIFIVGMDAVSGAITVGSIIIFVSYFERVRGPLENITNNIGDLIAVKSGVARIMTILDRKTIMREAPNMPEFPENWEKIEFVNVGFRYKDKWILKNFNLTIKRGEKIGIVGRSGCGKSTLVKLLLGMYKIQEGKILVDGLDFQKLKHSSVTKNIAIVLQDSEMFNSSLKDNLTITTENPDPLLLKRAVLLAELDNLIKKLPKGLDTLIGEKGYKVSGGERQRIGLGRAIYRNSNVLVLDEATSSLDSKTESVIQDNIERYLSEKTMLIIAHRLSTLKKVSRIIVMDRGRIAETGTFEELTKQRGMFYELYQLQKNKEAI